MNPTLRMVTQGAPQNMNIKIYDMAGHIVHRAALPAPSAIVGADGRAGYEYAWRTGRTASGVYLYVLEAQDSQGAAVKAAGKLALVR